MATSMKGYGLPPKAFMSARSTCSWFMGFKAVVASLRPVLVHAEAVQKGDAGVAHLGLLQHLRYAAETGAGILVDGLDGSPAGVGHVSYGFFGPRWACQASTSSSRAWKPLRTPQSTLVR